VVAPDEDAHGALAASAMMHGLIDCARAEAIGSEFADAAEKKAMVLGKQANWREFGVGALVGGTVGVASAVMVPAAGRPRSPFRSHMREPGARRRRSRTSPVRGH
jgi:hypothetical protein